MATRFFFVCLFCGVAAAVIWFGYWILLVVTVVVVGLIGFIVATILVVINDHRMI